MRRYRKIVVDRFYSFWQNLNMNSTQKPTATEIKTAAYLRGMQTDSSSDHSLMYEGHAWVATMTTVPAAHANLMSVWREGISKARYEQARVTA